MEEKRKWEIEEKEMGEVIERSVNEKQNKERQRRKKAKLKRA